MRRTFVLALAAVCHGVSCEAAAPAGDVHILAPGENRTIELRVVRASGGAKPDHVQVCFRGSLLNPLRVWHRGELRFESSVGPAIVQIAQGVDARPFEPLGALSRLLFPRDSASALDEVRYVSPYGQSCVRVAQAESRSSKPAAVHASARFHFVWHLPLMLCVGAVLAWCSRGWSQHTAFYYASGAGVALVLGVLLAGLFVVDRVLSGKWRRVGASALMFLGYLGKAADVLRTSAEELLGTYWRLCLLYVLLCGGAGLAWVHRAVCSASGVPDWWRGVTHAMLLVGGVAMALSSTYSTALQIGAVSAALALGLAAAACPAAPRAAMWAYLFEAQPAPAPTRTILASKRWLSAEEYEMQGEIETERALKDLCSSPAFQRWLLTNHRGMTSHTAAAAAQSPT